MTQDSSKPPDDDSPRLHPKLDFSEFHPLDHWAFDKRCRSLPGGGRRHLELWHEYMAPDPLGWLLCRIGHHEIVPYWTRHVDDSDPPTGWTCSRCGGDMENPQQKE